MKTALLYFPLEYKSIISLQQTVNLRNGLRRVEVEVYDKPLLRVHHSFVGIGPPRGEDRLYRGGGENIDFITRREEREWD